MLNLHNLLLLSGTKTNLRPMWRFLQTNKRYLTATMWRRTAPLLRSVLVKTSSGNSCIAEERRKRQSPHISSATELPSPLHKAEPQIFVHTYTESQPSLHKCVCYIKNLKSSRIKNTYGKRTSPAEASLSIIKGSSWNAV